jgi:hypothetical protein
MGAPCAAPGPPASPPPSPRRGSPRTAAQSVARPRPPTGDDVLSVFRDGDADAARRLGDALGGRRGLASPAATDAAAGEARARSCELLIRGRRGTFGTTKSATVSKSPEPPVSDAPSAPPHSSVRARRTASPAMRETSPEESGAGRSARLARAEEKDEERVGGARGGESGGGGGGAAAAGAAATGAVGGAARCCAAAVSAAQTSATAARASASGRAPSPSAGAALSRAEVRAASMLASSAVVERPARASAAAAASAVERP